METATIQKHQSLIDIALQYCGSADALFQIAELNNLEPTEDVAPGRLLLLPDVFIINKRNVKYLKDGGFIPVTGPASLIRREGLDYWALELDFIII